MEASRSCRGTSLKMMECYALLTLVRLFSIIPFEGCVRVMECTLVFLAALLHEFPNLRP